MSSTIWNLLIFVLACGVVPIAAVALLRNRARKR